MKCCFAEINLGEKNIYVIRAKVTPEKYYVLEDPWKTLALNEQFRKKRGCEFSTITSGTERERVFKGIVFLRREPLSKTFKQIQTVES